MLRVAIIEDNLAHNDRYRDWIESTRSTLGVEFSIDQILTRDQAEQAIGKSQYDLVVLDIQLGVDTHAGVALMGDLKNTKPTVVLVVSSLPPENYRGVMKALNAWDFVPKGTSMEQEVFTQTVLEILRNLKTRQSISSEPPKNEHVLTIDIVSLGRPQWSGKPINMPLTSQRIAKKLFDNRGHTVTYQELYKLVPSGRTPDNIRKHVSVIRDAIRDVDPSFNDIRADPGNGFEWK